MCMIKTYFTHFHAIIYYCAHFSNFKLYYIDLVCFSHCLIFCQLGWIKLLGLTNKYLWVWQNNGRKCSYRNHILKNTNEISVIEITLPTLYFSVISESILRKIIKWFRDNPDNLEQVNLLQNYFILITNIHPLSYKLIGIGEQNSTYTFLLKMYFNS